LAVGALTLAVVLLWRALISPAGGAPLRIRIAGITTNISPAGFEWNVVVPKPAARGDAVLFWSVRFQETNKSAVHSTLIDLSPGERDVTGIVYGPGESGILTWSYGSSLKPETVYRVIGCYTDPNSFWFKLRSWCPRVPMINGLLPQSPGTFATSEWFEVSSTIAKP